MTAYRLYVYPATVGHLSPQMSGQMFRDGEPYFGIAGCEDQGAVIDAATEQIGPDAELEIVYDYPGDVSYESQGTPEQAEADWQAVQDACNKLRPRSG